MAASGGSLCCSLRSSRLAKASRETGSQRESRASINTLVRIQVDILHVCAVRAARNYVVPFSAARPGLGRQGHRQFEMCEDSMSRYSCCGQATYGTDIVARPGPECTL
eukprot:scaffold4044_cov399-Prasinococcus_capsulatus_cf.AAC.18